MFDACVEVCFKLWYSFRISLYYTQCFVMYWLCEQLFSREKTIHLLTPYKKNCKCHAIGTPWTAFICWPSCLIAIRTGKARSALTQRLLLYTTDIIFGEPSTDMLYIPQRTSLLDAFAAQTWISRTCAWYEKNLWRTVRVAKKRWWKQMLAIDPSRGMCHMHLMRDSVNLLFTVNILLFSCAHAAFGWNKLKEAHWKLAMTYFGTSVKQLAH